MPEKKKSNAVPAAPKENPQAIDKPEAAPVELKQLSRAKPKDFKRAEIIENRFVHVCDAEDTPDDILRPDYWSHVADRMTVLGHITAINKVHGWEAELRILQISNKLVKVVSLGPTVNWDTSVGSGETDRLKSNYTVSYRAEGWRVIDVNGNLLISGLGSEQEAQNYIAQLVKSIAA